MYKDYVQSPLFIGPICSWVDFYTYERTEKSYINLHLRHLILEFEYKFNKKGFEVKWEAN